MARRQLERVIDLAQDRTLLADAWFWMSETSLDPKEKRSQLESTLAYDIHHAQARRSLAILDGKLIPGEIIDPENPPQTRTDSAQISSAERFTCQKCGGKMSFAPDGFSLVCEYCNRNLNIKAEVLQEEQDFIIAMATARGHLQPTLMNTFICQGCGADFLLAAEVISCECSFCGSAHVVAPESKQMLIEPDCIIPMVLLQSQANEQLYLWIQNNKVQPDNPPEPVRGVYLPIWSFDIGGHVAWSGERKQNNKVTHINDEDIVSFNDLAIPASKTLSALLVRIMGSYDLVNAPAYNARFLAGWPAKVYEIPMVESSLEARQKASQLIERRIVSKDGALENLKYSTAEIYVDTFKLTLVPVWISSFHVQSKKYSALISGQSGEVQTEVPRRGLTGWLKQQFSI